MSDLLSILIPTYNEEAHIARCLLGAFEISPRVYVLDSNSTDRTREIAEDMGAIVLAGNSFSCFSEKLNWALENIDFTTPWVLRLDADEVPSEELIERVGPFLEGVDSDVSGVYVRRQLWFMGRWIRHGGMYPTYSMRIWRPDAVRCEQRVLDEHMLLRRGRHLTLGVDVKDIPLTSISTWIDKHNRYSTLEALSISGQTEDPPDDLLQPRLLGALPQRVRWMKGWFYRMPLLVRPFLYFIYRYFIRLGFLDGYAGFIFHFLHGLWYRVLIDVKIIELRRQAPSPGTR